MLYEQQVTAGVPLQLNVPGRFFLLDSTGDEDSVTVELLRGGSPIVGRIPGARRGLKIGIDGGFDGVRIEAPENTMVRFFATFENVSISTSDGAKVEIPGGVVVTNGAENPVPVVHTGTVELTAENVGIILADTLTDTGLIAAADAVSAMLPAATSRRGFRLRNAGPDAVAIGGAAVSYATAAVIIQAGETWNESEAPGAAWFAVCDAAKTASLYVLEVSN